MNEIYFFIHSDSGALIFLNTVMPWSLYKPKSFILCFSLILFNINMPTNSKILVPSYGLMVTSKKFPFSRFFITKQKWFSGIIHNFYAFDAHISYFFSKVECFLCQKSDLIPTFIFQNFKKPFYNLTCTFPLVSSCRVS